MHQWTRLSATSPIFIYCVDLNFSNLVGIGGKQNWLQTSCKRGEFKLSRIGASDPATPGPGNRNKNNHRTIFAFCNVMMVLSASRLGKFAGNTNNPRGIWQRV